MKEILGECKGYGGSIVQQSAVNDDVKLIAVLYQFYLWLLFVHFSQVNPQALHYLYDARGDFENLVHLKECPDVRFFSLPVLREFLEKGEVDKSKDIFASGT